MSLNYLVDLRLPDTVEHWTEANQYLETGDVPGVLMEYDVDSIKSVLIFRFIHPDAII